METKNNEHYLSLVRDARKSQLKIYRESYTHIRDLYKDVAKDLEIRNAHTKNFTLTDRFVSDYKKQVQQRINEMTKVLEARTLGDMQKVAALQANVQLDFFDLVGMNMDMQLSRTFKDVLTRIPEEALFEIVSGRMYKDHRGISERIWNQAYHYYDDVGYMLERAIAEKKSVYEFSKDIEKYVDPDAKKEWEWKKVYPNAGSRTVDYNAQRLARTSINHAFFMANMRGCEKNPFVTAINWGLSGSHYDRQVEPFGEDECDMYANQDGFGLGTGNFPKNRVPVPHPQCLCHQAAVIPKSIREVANEIGDWMSGSPNQILDQWYQQYGFKYE